jgi:hypothetical protein
MAEAHMSAQLEESQSHMYLAGPIFRRTSECCGGEDERIVRERTVAEFCQLELISRWYTHS